MIRIQFREPRGGGASTLQRAVEPGFFRDDYPLGLEEDERDPEYVAAMAADAAIYSVAGCESHLWIG